MFFSLSGIRSGYYFRIQINENFNKTSFYLLRPDPPELLPDEPELLEPDELDPRLYEDELLRPDPEYDFPPDPELRLTGLE